jgi:hypothetical protein
MGVGPVAVVTMQKQEERSLDAVDPLQGGANLVKKRAEVGVVVPGLEPLVESEDFTQVPSGHKPTRGIAKCGHHFRERVGRLGKRKPPVVWRSQLYYVPGGEKSGVGVQRFVGLAVGSLKPNAFQGKCIQSRGRQALVSPGTGAIGPQTIQ